MKEINGLEEWEVENLKNIKEGKPVDDSNHTGSDNNAVREVKFLSDLKQDHKPHNHLIRLEQFTIHPPKRKLRIYMTYFGGTDCHTTDLFDFFRIKSYHKDLGYNRKKTRLVVY